jgi:NADP-dependent 3-hydroxy acid dehydrogenase YdfG
VEGLINLQQELGGPETVHVLPIDVRDRAATEAMVSGLPVSRQEIDVCVNTYLVSI